MQQLTGKARLLDDLFHVELSGDSRRIYSLSRAGGQRSGWSVGRIQYDFPNNPRAKRLLMDCGIGEDTLYAIRDIPTTRHPAIVNINKVLSLPQNKVIIDLADEEFIDATVAHFQKIGIYGPLAEAPSLFRMAVALEYHCQMYVADNGKFEKWLMSKDRSGQDDVSFAEDYLAFKETLPWWHTTISEGFLGKHDTLRRLGVLKQRYAVGAEPRPDWIVI